MASPTVTVTARSQPNLFGTVALPTTGGLWSEKWSKVASDGSVPAALGAIIRPAQGLTRIQQLSVIQAKVDRRIGWRSDGTAYGERDYWATAAETLNAGYGDDEDRAILKFQALRALGWKPSDMYLVMGRDYTRGSYTMLAARANGRFWLLEDRGDTLVPMERRTGFTPMVSFGDGRAWLHGKRHMPASLSTTPFATATRAVAARR
jgi:predicted transglutaminase-like cysteine proteinase